MKNQSPKGTFLIVDDEPNLCEILADAVEPIAERVLLAPDGLKALEIIQNHSVDLVLSDLRMPGLDGFELLKSVRKLGLSTPFILMAAHADRDIIQNGIDLGSLYFLVKPFDIHLQESLVAKALATATGDLPNPKSLVA